MGTDHKKIYQQLQRVIYLNKKNLQSFREDSHYQDIWSIKKKRLLKTTSQVVHLQFMNGLSKNIILVL